MENPWVLLSFYLCYLDDFLDDMIASISDKNTSHSIRVAGDANRLCVRVSKHVEQDQRVWQLGFATMKMYQECMNW